MRIENDVKLDFKDVLIRPKRSTLNSRNEVDIHRTFRFLHTGAEWTGFPLISANMDVTGTLAMARALGRFDALTALHKHYPVDKLAEFFGGPDGAHAFYLGAELTKAEIAFQLGKRYAQDEPLDWGCAVDRRTEDRTRLSEAGHTLRARTAGE